MNKQSVFNEKKYVEWGGFLNEFLWTCAGVNRKVLRQCPPDYAKYAGIGGTILFTALMAMLSGGYAMFTVFHSIGIAVGFGVFWGLLIFNLDRFIVNTMYSDGKATISFMEFLSGLPRIIMAIFLGIVISTPLELKIFEDEINVVIEEQKQDRIKKYQEGDNAKILNLQSRRDSISAKKTELQNAPMQIDWTFGNNEQINDLITENNKKRIEYEEYKSQIEENRQARRRLLSNSNHEDSIKAKNLTATINELQARKNSISKEITQVDSKIASLAGENTKIAEKARNEKDTALSFLQQDIFAIDQEILDIKSSMRENGYEEILQNEYGGFQAKMSAFSQMKEENSSTRLSSLFIMLLFVIIETAPTFFKMMMEDGPYDHLLHAEKEMIRLNAMDSLRDYNEELQANIQISSERNKERIEAEKKANNLILDKVSSIQLELLDEALQKWKSEELSKIEEDPSKFISING